MKIHQIAEYLNAKVLCGSEFLDRDIMSACAADMMSDVLAYVKEQGVLLTGLMNPQVIRTAEMMDIGCVVFVRGKKPDAKIISIAAEKEIVVLATSETMFSACGILYKSGLDGVR